MQKPSRSHEYQWKMLEIPVDMSPTGKVNNVFTQEHALYQTQEPENINLMEKLDNATQHIFKAFLSILTPFQRQIVDLSLQGLTQVEIAKAINCQQSYVSRILNGYASYYASAFPYLRVETIRAVLTNEEARLALQELYALAQDAEPIRMISHAFHSHSEFLSWLNGKLRFAFKSNRLWAYRPKQKRVVASHYLKGNDMKKLNQKDIDIITTMHKTNSKENDPYLRQHYGLTQSRIEEISFQNGDATNSD